MQLYQITSLSRELIQLHFLFLFFRQTCNQNCKDDQAHAGNDVGHHAGGKTGAFGHLAVGMATNIVPCVGLVVFSILVAKLPEE